MNRRRWIGERGISPVLFGLFSIVLAWVSAGVSFLDDDWGHVRLCEAGLRRLLTTSWTGLSGAGVYYRPVVSTSLYLNFLISGYGPALYHVTNVLIHCGCCVLVYLLFRRLFPEAPARSAWAALLLFCVLPIHTDTVFWVVGRTDSLCVLFYLGTLLLFLRYVDRPSGVLLLGFGACFLLALYAKEMALSLPGALAVLACYRQAFRQSAARRALVLSVVLLGVYMGTRQMVLGGVFAGSPRPTLSPLDWVLQILRAGAMIGMTDVKLFGGIVFLVTGGLLVRLGWRSEVFRDVRYLAAMTLISLIPALGGVNRWYLYLPSVFAAMAIARIWMDQFPQRRVCRWGLAVLFSALVAYYGLTLVREGVLWRRTSTLSEAFIREMRPHVQEAGGTVYAVNVPSACSLPGSLGEKPLFAFALVPALGVPAGRVVAVNYLWLLDEKGARSEVTHLGPGRFRVTIQEGGFFSFHGPDAGLIYARDGRTVLEKTVERPWGRLEVTSRIAIEAAIDLAEGDRVVVYDEGKVKLVYEERSIPDVF